MAKASMAIKPDQLILGLTGSFGSGTSYIKSILKERFGFEGFSLSREVFDYAEKQGRDRRNRAELQAIGNELRKSNGNDYLARKALERAAETFIESDEDDPAGQHVQACVDQADIVISNDVFYRSIEERENALEKKLSPYIRLITGEIKRRPYQKEMFMSLASNLARRSSCMKRKGGAVIVDSNSDVISVGFNEVPLGRLPCEDVYGDCYRDIKKKKMLAAINVKRRSIRSCSVVRFWIFVARFMQKSMRYYAWAHAICRAS